MKWILNPQSYKKIIENVTNGLILLFGNLFLNFKYSGNFIVLEKICCHYKTTINQYSTVFCIRLSISDSHCTNIISTQKSKPHILVEIVERLTKEKLFKGLEKLCVITFSNNIIFYTGLNQCDNNVLFHSDPSFWIFNKKK